jgi:hypothetical protein
MTLNQAIARIKSIAESHKQIHHFYFGDIVEWLSNGEVTYPACFVDINSATIDKANRQTRYTVELWLADLVNVSKDARENEQEVFSDLISIVEDLTALICSPQFQDDWTVSEVFPLQLYKEKFEDWTAAVKVTLDIATDYLSDECQVPKL